MTDDPSTACADGEHTECYRRSCPCDCHRFQRRVTAEQVRELKKALKEEK